MLRIDLQYKLSIYIGECAAIGHGAYKILKAAQHALIGDHVYNGDNTVHSAPGGGGGSTLPRAG